MIILDDSYVSNRMCRYLELSKQPVLESEISKRLVAEGVNISLVSEDEAIARINAGEPLYAMSESHFDWVAKNVSKKNILHGLSIFKDKEKMRELLAPMYPDYFYQAVDADALAAMPFPAERAPFVLKPSVGFLSLGIHIIRTEEDWIKALFDIAQHKDEWSRWYDQSVIEPNRFIMESLIEGTEYAIDAYYDQDGEPHLLNILRHDFANAEDTADRLYVCGKQIMLEKKQLMLDFLKQANEHCKVSGFPVHVEVRESNGVVYPIEFNPLRFAGLGGTEISQMAFGFYTFAHYLQNTEPNWDAAFERAGDDLYCMSVLNPPANTPAGTKFDYDAFAEQWGEVLAMDRFNFDTSGIMGFQFWKTSAIDDSERVRMLNDDLREYLIYPNEGAPAAAGGFAGGILSKRNKPTEYSPNKRHPNAARRHGAEAPENPEPPKVINEENPFDNDKNPFGRGVDPFGSMRTAQPQPRPGSERKRYVPTTMQKLLWSGAAFMFGFFGLIFIFFLGIKKPAEVRFEMLKWAGVGLVAMILFELVVLYVFGGGTGAAGSMGASGGTGSSGGAF